MTHRAGLLLLAATTLVGCSGPGSTASTSTGGFSSTGSIGSTGSTGAVPNASLEGDLAFSLDGGGGGGAGGVGAFQLDPMGAEYPDGGIGYLSISIFEGLACTPDTDLAPNPYVYLVIGESSGPALTTGYYPVGDGGSDAPPVDAGANVTAYLDPNHPSSSLSAENGFVFFNAVSEYEVIGNFSVNMALPDGGVGQLAGSFDVTNTCSSESF